MLSIGLTQCSDFMKLRLEIFILVFMFSMAIFFSNYRIVNEKILIIENTDKNTKTTLFLPDERFTLTYIHSVQKTPVHEFFFVNNDNKLVLNKTIFQSLGVGLPFSEEDGKLTNKDGKFILQMHREFDSIPIKVSPIPKHSIIIDNDNYPLLNFASPEDLLSIQAAQRLRIKNISRKEQENG